MPFYVSDWRLRKAISSLSASKIKHGRLFDFLIVKRLMKLKNASTVAVVESDDASQQALDEIGASTDGDGNYVNPRTPYLNVFIEGSTGKAYRTPKYASNGTNTNVAGKTWTQYIFDLSGSNPRKVSLKKDYIDNLGGFFLSKGVRPNLTEAALWYFRERNVESIVSGAQTPQQSLQGLTDAFVSEVGLVGGEISELFDLSIDISAPNGSSIFQPNRANPADYLPGKKQKSQRIRDEDLTVVSFALATALAAKNFVILTGPSGTGKSRAALKLAEAVQAQAGKDLPSRIFELIPVGPDWTSPKRLVGYKTPFGKERRDANGAVTNESYEITSTLRLILRAHHPLAAAVPHFLVFDEMNLSHVERYFAPFLSLMEAGAILSDEAGISLIDADDFALVASVLKDEDSKSLEAEAAEALLEAGQALVLPPNLFFVGTVNVDETTYMFSPKVLDRAHVIELNAEKPSDYLKGDRKSVAGDKLAVEVAVKILEGSIGDRAHLRNEVSNPADLLNKISDLGFTPGQIHEIRIQLVAVLDGCFESLAPVGFPFGYRISKEVFVYIISWLITKHQAGSSATDLLTQWPEALDRAILQKVLPKIHGNRRTLGDSLKSLSSFLSGQESSASKVGNRLELPGEKPYLPLSRDKLDALVMRLGAGGYVSFVS